MPRQNQRNNQNNPCRKEPIDAPYNFVPLADKIVTPNWAKLVSHDLPFKDGISGEIHYTLTAHSPLLVGGERIAATANAPGKVSFFTTPDNKFAIPGSSIKGMIRSVLEIATFSRMSMVDNCRYSVRDLTNLARPFYGDKMTARVTPNSSDYSPKPQAGWLNISRDGNWQITPCKYSRVEQFDDRDPNNNHLAALSNDDWWKAVPRKSAKEKYTQWGNKCSLNIMFNPEPITLHHHSGGKRLKYSKATHLGTGETCGTLVFTGQPAARPAAPEAGKPDERSGKKHMEFIFYSPNSSLLFTVPANVMQDFLHIHRKHDGYKGEEWEYWKNKPQIPIFYLTDSQGKIESFGLALMYKLAYSHSIHQIIGHTGDGVHLKTNKPDFATLMFGHIGDEPKQMLKGRIWFETAIAVDNTAKVLDAQTVVLNAPKPTYYPNYIEQPAGSDNKLLHNKSYKTYMNSSAKIRGWKRYPTRPELTIPTPGTDAVSTALHPLNAGATFDGRMIFHNLKPVELGALLWVMSWGGKPNLRHGLGMGKSLGYGQVSLIINNHILTPNSGSPESELTNYIKIFANYMEKHLPGWGRSLQISTLCGMASPDKAKNFNANLQHMPLEKVVCNKKINPFVEAKKDHLVLAPYPLQPWHISDIATPKGNGPTIWLNVKTNAKNNFAEISASSKNNEKAYARGEEAKKLLVTLNRKSKTLLKKGDYKPTLPLNTVVEKITKSSSSNLHRRVKDE